MWVINTLGVCVHSDAHMLLFPSSSKNEPGADGEVVVGMFLGNCMPILLLPFICYFFV